MANNPTSEAKKVSKELFRLDNLQAPSSRYQKKSDHWFVPPIPILLLLLFILGLFSALAFAEMKRITTVAGEFQYFQNEKSSECIVLLNKKPILKFDCESSYLPEVVSDFKEKLGSLDEVVVLQEMPMGNACNGGPLHFIGFRRDKSFRVSGPLDFCGGKDPIIKRQGEKIFITFPGGPPNIGSGYIPTEKWQYHNGQLKKIK